MGEEETHRHHQRKLAVVAKKKAASPTWIDVKTALRAFDRAGLQGLVHDLYAASKKNQEFLHARLGLGPDPLNPYKTRISDSICPDVMRNQPISVSGAKKAIADYRRAIGRPDGLAELSVFYCEEALSFLESCGLDDEGYFVALIRMYDRSLEIVSQLPRTERSKYLKRLDQLRSRTKHIGWGVQDELNDLWCSADLDENQSD